MIQDLLAAAPVVELTGQRFVPRAGRRDRVTLAWVENGRLRGKMLDGRALTVVVVWPTDARGRLDRDRLEHAVVMEWLMSPRGLLDLQRWADAWPVERHDFMVGSGVGPCPTTLRRSELWTKLEWQVERAVDLLAR
jgi:hypothetical protein